MPQVSDEAIREALAPGRALTESDTVIAEALGAANGRSLGLKRRRVLVAVALTILVPATALAVQAFRAEPGSAGGAFSNYLDGVKPATWPGVPYEGKPPIGRSLNTNDGNGPTKSLLEYGVEPRILARNGNLRLYVVRTEDGGGMLFEWAGVGRGMGREDLYKLADDAVGRLGPGPRFDGLTALYGVANDAVRTVRMTYADGPPSKPVSADGGFILLVDSTRDPQRIEGLNAQGQVVGSTGAGCCWGDEARDVRRERPLRQ
jgi:hypothetical protein